VKRVPTPLPGVFVIEPERLEDERGFFARLFCATTFRDWGLEPLVCQCSVSFNRQPGTLRGMHWQAAPHGEAKLVRCTSGALFDVALDLRADSPAYKQWFGVELSAANRRMLYIPEGVAHGFQTLAPDTEVHYQISRAHEPESARGVRWDDPAFGIAWPSAAARVISGKDAGYPDFDG
jgi:dTDP-4-dehydrorhamnose 3,5-epimerase